MKKGLGFIVIPLLVVLTGCSGKPAESDLERVIENRLDACAGEVHIQNFHQTDSRDVGDSTYVAEVQFDYVLMNEAVIPPGDHDTNRLPMTEQCAWMYLEPAMLAEIQKAQKTQSRLVFPMGTTRHMTINMTYNKNYNGDWLLDDTQLYTR
jgi:predicted component of type VI protein secretion system